MFVVCKAILSVLPFGASACCQRSLFVMFWRLSILYGIRAGVNVVRIEILIEVYTRGSISSKVWHLQLFESSVPKSRRTRSCCLPHSYEVLVTSEDIIFKGEINGPAFHRKLLDVTDFLMVSQMTGN